MVRVLVASDIFEHVSESTTVGAEVLDVGWAPDQVAAWAAQADFGAGMWTPFGPLDPATLSRAGRLDLLIGWERTRAWVDAQQQSLLAALAEDPDFAPTADPAARHWVREEVACALRLSPQTAAARLADAADLTSRLPATLAAVQSGQITLPHARALLDAVRTLPDPAASAVETTVLTRAARQTLAEFKRSVTRAAALLTLHADGSGVVSEGQARGERTREPLGAATERASVCSMSAPTALASMRNPSCP